MRLRLMAALGLLLALFGCAGNRPTVVGVKKIKYNLPRLLHVYKNGVEGAQSAVVVGYKGYLLTTAHSTDVDRIIFRTRDDYGTVKSFVPRIVAKSRGYDLALLKVNTTFPSVVTLGPPPAAGERVYLQSYALTGNSSLADITGLVVKPQMAWNIPPEGFNTTDGMIISFGHEGASGSPVFNSANADLVGIYKMTGKNVVTNTDHGFLIGSETIRRFLVANNLRDAL